MERIEHEVTERLPARLKELAVPPIVAGDKASEAAIVLGKPEHWEHYRSEYARTGRIREFDEFRRSFNYVKDTGLRQRMWAAFETKSLGSGITAPETAIFTQLAEAAKNSQTEADGGVTYSQLIGAAIKQRAQDPEADERFIALGDVTAFDEKVAGERVEERAKVAARMAEHFAKAPDLKDQAVLGVAETVAAVTAPLDEVVMFKVAAELGIPKRGLYGEQIEAIEDWILSHTDTESRINAQYRVIEAIANNSPGQDAGIWEYLRMGDIFTEDGALDDSQLTRWLGNLGSVMAVLGPLSAVPRLVKRMRVPLTSHSLGATPAALAKGSPSLAQQYLAKHLEALQNSVDLRSAVGISPEAIVLTQLPKPDIGGMLDVVPDGVMEAAEISRAGATRVMANLQAGLYTPAEVTAKAEAKAKEIVARAGVHLRPALSEVKLSEAGDAMEFSVVLGSRTTGGFRDVPNAEAVAQQLRKQGEEVSLWQVDPKTNTLVPIFNPTAETYVRVKQTVFMRPEDKALFEAPVNTSSWLSRWVSSPASQFSHEVFKTYNQAVLGEAALAQKLDSIVQPLFRDYSAAERVRVGNIWTWVEQFGYKEERAPKLVDIKAAFPDATEKDLKGIAHLKLYYDTVYEIQNQRLYRDLKGRGAVTVRGPTGRYHGVPEEPKGNVTALDIEGGLGVNLKAAEVREALNKGFRFVRLDSAVDALDGKTAHTLLIVPPTGPWGIKALDSNPLRYIEGYTPRVYKDPHIVQRVTTKVVDGVEQEVRAGMVVAPTREEAELFAARERGKLKNPKERIEVAPDARLSTKDRTALDLDILRTEGRLFFDERQQTRLASTRGGLAEVVDPINMLDLTTRVASRQVATEDLIKVMKSSWKETYGDLVPGPFDPLSSSQVADILRTKASELSGEAGRRASQARILWDYIRVMEGAGSEPLALKRASIQAGEWLSARLGMPEVARATAKGANPVRWLRSLAHFTFLTTTPARQLVMQGLQHAAIWPVLLAKNPVYAATPFRWQLDTTLLMLGAKKSSTEAVLGKTATNRFAYTAAKLMGLTIEEYKLLVEKFLDSGLGQSANMTTVFGGVPAPRRATPETALGRAGAIALGAATARPVRTFAERYGFELGEKTNLTAAYVAAVKLLQGGKKLTQLSGEDWREISQKASDLALAMTRANTSAYQRGLASVPLQFLSFTHKATLVALKGLGFKNIGPAGWTVHEARVFLAGQLLMFGGAALGIRRFVQDGMASIGVENPDLIDLVAGGLVDYVLDESFQSLSGDEDLDLQFDAFLSVLSGSGQTLVSFYEAAFEKPLAETALGASLEPLSRIGQAVQIARTVSLADEMPLGTAQKAELVANAFLAGIAQGYSNYTRAKAAHRLGVWTTSTGSELPIEAKYSEIVAKGLFGINPQSIQDFWDVGGDSRALEADLKKDAKTYYDRAVAITNLYGNGIIGNGEFATRISAERALFETLDENERLIVQKELNSLERRHRQTGDGLAEIVAKRLSAGLKVDQALRNTVATTPAITDERQRAALLQWIDSALAKPDTTNVLPESE